MPTANEIRTFQFSEEGLDQVRKMQYGKNWPVIYLIHDDENLYIGETTNVAHSPIQLIYYISHQKLSQ